MRTRQVDQDLHGEQHQRMNRAKGWFLFGLLMGSLVSFFPSQSIAKDDSNQPVDAPIASQIDDWLIQLNSSSYRTRQQAFLNLWKLGENSRDVLDQMAKSDDLNAAATAKWLMLIQKLGPSPAEVSEGISNLGLVQAGDFYTLIRMGQEHQWAQIMVVLELLSEQQLDELKDQSSPEQLLSLAIKDERMELLPLLVDYFYSPVNRLAARHQWRTREIDVGDASAPGQPLDETATIFEQEWKGQIDEAIRLSSTTSPLISQFIQHRHFRWRDLIPAEKELTLSDKLTLTQRAVIGRYLEWVGDVDLSRQWKNRVAEQAQGNATPSSPTQTALALMVAGHWDESLELWRDIEPGFAIVCYKLHGQVEKALGIVGIEPTQDFDWEKFLKQKEDEVKDTSERGLTLTFLIESASTLHQLGLVDEADDLEEWILKSANEVIEDRMLRQWVQDDRFERAFRHLGDPSSIRPRTLTDEKLDRINQQLDTLFPDFKDHAFHLLKTLRAFEGNATATNYLGTLHRLHSGSIPEHWKGVDDLQRFLMQSYRSTPLQTSDRAGLVKILIEISKNAGYLELASRLIQDFGSESFEPELFAQISAELGDLESAQQYLQILDSQQQAEMPHWIQRAQWLQQLGHRDRSKQLMESVWALPIWPELADKERRFRRLTCTEVAEQIDKIRPKTEAGKDLVELAFVLTQPEDRCLHELAYDLAVREEKSNPERATNLARLAQAEFCLQSKEEIRFPWTPMLWETLEHRCAARAALQLRDQAAADRHYRQAFAIRPDDIDLAIELVPLAEEAFGKTFADTWFEIFHKHYSDHLQRWPRDAMYLNNLAWLQAKLERNLEDAWRQAEKAVELKPNPTYIDTLSEVEFRRGNIDRAIELTRRCIRINGKDAHHKEQMLRFIQAKKENHQP